MPKPVLLLLVFFLLMVPLALITNLVSERADYRREAVQEISTGWTGAQTLLGPVVVVDYEVALPATVWDPEAKKSVETVLHESRTALVPVNTLDVQGDVTTETRYRGIHAARVYTAELQLEGSWSANAFNALRPDDSVTIKRTQLWIWLADRRGFISEPHARWNERELAFEAGGHAALGHSGIVADLERPGEDASFSIGLTLRGSGELGFVPTSNQADYAMRADWPHPSFRGRYLPVGRAVDAEGLQASWSTTSLSSNTGAALDRCAAGECASLRAQAFGVAFIDPVDQYQRALRATKYGVLFMVVLFGAVIAVEIKARLEVHPIQYGLVGAALAIFFLLLLSLSEHLPFAAAYTVAAGMSTALLGFYGRGVFASAALGGAFAAGIAVLFALLYVILGREDTALLMGSLLTFVLLAALMYLTADTEALRAFRMSAADDSDDADVEARAV